MRKDKNLKYWIPVVVAIMVVIACSHIPTEQERLQKKYDNIVKAMRGQTELARITESRLKQQQRNAIVHNTSGILDSLKYIQAEIDTLNLAAFNLVEQIARDYWNTNFNEYKKFIDSKFTASEKQQLSDFVGMDLILGPNIVGDTGKFNLNDILYGPYWEYLYDTISPEHEWLANRYKDVRMAATKKFPYMFLNNCFYSYAPAVMHERADATHNDIVFGLACNAGQEIAWDIYRKKYQHTENDPVKEKNGTLYEHNQLTSKTRCTPQIPFILCGSSIETDEYFNRYLNLSVPFFDEHRKEIDNIVKQLDVLQKKQKRLELERDSTEKQIKKEYEQEIYKQTRIYSNEYNRLNKELDEPYRKLKKLQGQTVYIDISKMLPTMRGF